MPTATQVRASLVAALRADLVGPFDPTQPEERLTVPPSRWYLTGFLAPQADRETRDPTAEDELEGAQEDDDEESSAPEPEPKQKNHFPASMGLSVLLPPALEGEPELLRATVTFADYVREESPLPENPRRKKVTWRRVPHAPSTVALELSAEDLARGAFLPDTHGVELVGKLETFDAPGLEKGTRGLSLFVLNRRPPAEKGRLDESYLFQVELELRFARGFVARPDRRGESAPDWDYRVADLQYRAQREWGVGHNVAVSVPEDPSAMDLTPPPPLSREGEGGGEQRTAGAQSFEARSSNSPLSPSGEGGRGGEVHGPRVHSLRTTWLPTAEVRRVVTHDEPSVVTSMDALAALADGPSAREALAPLAVAYGAWLDAQSALPLEGEARQQTRARLLANARHAQERIAAAVERLASDPEARAAFCWMNRAMADAARQRSPERYPAGKSPSWRLFQLAFVLLSLTGLADETHEDREVVELLFFPTGGGKTEAYLGVIGFTLLLRRLRGSKRPDGGLGVAVLLRYTLRLLTLDQLGRAATLICALELLRRAHPAELGSVRFAVGLWVGRSATANTLEQVKKLVLDYKNSPAKNAASPFPLTACPWCGATLGRESVVLDSPSKPTEVLVRCVTAQGQSPSQCEFSPRKSPEGIPVLFVDEQLYRELPCFVVATVDKFAMLPWRGETGMLFGRVSAREGRRFYGPLDEDAPRSAARLPGGLLPPELIVQDELHLISGPLGTMVGLYETALERLCTRVLEGKPVRPKILASTATVRRAREQLRALFGRSQTALFPPPAVDAMETFFARVDHAAPGRLYVGVAAPGRALKAILLRTYVSLLGAAQKQYDPSGPPEQAADAYMTLAGYFNSLRELGGMRRLVEDDVRTRVGSLEKRVPENHVGKHPWGKNRSLAIPVELTSREKGAAIKEAKDRLGRPHAAPEHVDALLASNMISVGVDIDRLGLMVVAGQPKTTSEYIQASSRVGRQHPGLVVTCLNTRKPRDRSHFERFAAYHESFYRHVEATSLTPFSGPAVDRGLAGMLVAMTRLADPKMTPATAAMELAQHRALAEDCVRELCERAGRHSASADEESVQRLTESLRARGLKLLDAWEKLIHEARDSAAKRSYSPFDKDKGAGKPLLFTVVDEQKPEAHTLDARFAAPTSMRDVESTVHLWIERRALGGKS